ncbi:long-chain fatty acid--CoA ligase [Nocardia sp. NPDC051929]|uniref:class I adenylate-forming enzyme family protein n=1 Tax=unclassified Nocardia TaxID=2637762 RepID=UPI0034422052
MLRYDGLWQEVIESQRILADLEVGPDASVAVQLPPCVESTAVILATWRLGARLVIVDHRVPQEQWEGIVDWCRPQVTVTAANLQAGRDQLAVQYRPRPGQPRDSEHALILFSSGSTGLPKGIGRTVSDLMDEVEKTAGVDGAPAKGECIVAAISFAYAYGLFWLLHALRSACTLIIPEQVTAHGLLRCVQDSIGPTTLLGVPFHLKMLATVSEPPQLPQFRRVVSSGEAVDAELCELIAERFGVKVGQAYGMTEVGMIAADLDGRFRPAVGVLAPGVRAGIDHSGELLIAMEKSPYVDESKEKRWDNGWFRTGDAATLSPDGFVTLHGRLDSQIAVGGLKVDLMAIERIVTSVDGVREATVVHDGRSIKAYLALAESGSVDRVRAEVGRRLAAHQMPSNYHVLPTLPATPTGKRIRDPRRLAQAAEEAR